MRFLWLKLVEFILIHKAGSSLEVQDQRKYSRKDIFGNHLKIELHMM